MEDISLHIMDIAFNSIEAASSIIKIEIKAIKNDKILFLEISDDGRGISKKNLKNVTDPFITSRKTRKVGLGLSLLKQACKVADGDLTIESIEGKGTRVKAEFSIKNIDRPPLGDLKKTFICLLSSNENTRWVLELESINNKFKLDTDDIKQKIKGIDINRPEVLSWIEEYIEEGIKRVFGGVLDEVTS